MEPLGLQALRALPATRVTAIQARHWRNVSEAVWFPGPHFNVLSGDNGMGKTNWLELVALLATGRSFRGAPRADWVHADAMSATAALKLNCAGATHRLESTIEKLGKASVALDGAVQRSRTLIYQRMPLTLFHPAELGIIAQGDAARRDYLDSLLTSLDPSFSRLQRRYQRALASRNRLLKEGVRERAAHRPFETLVADAGLLLTQARQGLVKALAPLVSDVIHEVSGELLTPNFRYEPTLPATPDAARAHLEAHFERDLRIGSTRQGPHADAAYFELLGLGARYQASQGQHRLLVLGLKLAAFALQARAHGRVPLLLLDDVTSELDNTKRTRLFSLLGELGAQVFITTTHPSFVQLSHQREDFAVTRGEIRAREHP